MSEHASGAADDFEFHPAVSRWFRERFPDGPTPPQRAAWPAIASGHNTLVAAPTGSGKTLAAFLVCIDRLYRQAERGLCRRETCVVYVSPLKALALDIQHNLERPLREIAEVARTCGWTVPDLRVAVRTGDTKASARAAMLKHPPHFLVTTPESLYLLLTAERSRAQLEHVETIIVDEIHAVARDKRGAHLALTLERLEHVCRSRPVRIGLSATQRPIETVARLLVGADRAGNRCHVVDTGHQRTLDLGIELPSGELEAVASAEQMGEILDRIATHVRTQRTTLVFVNTRRMAERVAHQLSERLGADRVAAHHGSLAKERRLEVETRLREGRLGALIATASLELGIDIGPISLVCQIGSPRSIATFLQRVGRSGHSRFAIPVGRLYPTTRDELVECAALLRAVHAGRLDSLKPPVLPLDILAQQIIAECAAQEWDEDDLFGLVRRAAPYEGLERAEFEAVLTLASEGVATGRGKRGAYLRRDRAARKVKSRRSARLAALTSGGAIPETADYRVLADPDDTFVGTVNEDWAIESMIGDVFLLGSTSWRIRRVESGIVRVVDARGAPPSVPFWLGEAPARTDELSEEVSALREGVGACLDRGDAEAACTWLEREARLDRVASRALVEYLAAAHTALGLLPTARDLVYERFFDESGGMQLVVHAPLGGRHNRAFGLALRKRFCRSFDFELQAAANDDAVVLSLGPQHSFPLEDVPRFLSSSTVADVLAQAALDTPMFAARWRWNLNRALLVLRMRKGRKNPAPIQRMESDDLMAAIFPALAACQENTVGPRIIPDHPIVRQTMHDCLHEAMDLVALERLLSDVEAGRVRVHFRDTTEPSPLSHEILNARPYAFLDDAPLEERRTRAVHLRRGLPVQARDLAVLDPEAIARVRSEAALAPRDADELHDALLSLVVLRPDERWAEPFAALVAAGRASVAEGRAGKLWCAAENAAAAERLFPGCRVSPERGRAATSNGETMEALLARVVRGHLDVTGPCSIEGLSNRTLLEADSLAIAAAQLEHEGFALRGHFEPGEPEQFCSRRLLSRIHYYTVERLRREIEPVSAQDYLRFLLKWQHVQPGARYSTREGLLSVIEQLQGFELAAGAWEAHVLPARLLGYAKNWLDLSCLSGDVCWGRLALRGRDPERMRPLELYDRSAPQLPSRATRVTLALRADLPWLMHAARGAVLPAEPSSPLTQKVLATLRAHGALFQTELGQIAGLTSSEVAEALWDGVARGLVTADGFEPLRALLAGRAARRDVPERSAGLRRGRSGAGAANGRWSLLRPPAETAGVDALAEAVAEQLLSRWGVVFRDVLARETLALPWREVLWALRRLEARGTIRGGRFVTGFVGEQFALPAAIDALRGVRRSDRTGELVELSAADPLNLIGIIVPGARVPALRKNRIAYVDGLPLTRETGGIGAA